MTSAATSKDDPLLNLSPQALQALGTAPAAPALGRCPVQPLRSASAECPSVCSHACHPARGANTPPSPQAHIEVLSQDLSLTAYSQMAPSTAGSSLCWMLQTAPRHLLRRRSGHTPPTRSSSYVVHSMTQRSPHRNCRGFALKSAQWNLIRYLHGKPPSRIIDQSVCVSTLIWIYLRPSAFACIFLRRRTSVGH